MTALLLSLEQSSYMPGATLRAAVNWEFDDSTPPVHLRIGWKTSGIGTEDLEVVDVWQIETSNFTGSTAIERQLPDFPFSFSGKLITLSWFIEASVDELNLTSSADLIIAPAASEIQLNDATSG